MPSRTTPKLTQSGKFREQRRFEFVGMRRLRISDRSRRKSRSYVVDIIAMDPKSRSTIRVPWSWLKLTAVGATAALAGWLVLEPGGTALALVMTVSGGVSLAGLVMVISGTSRRQVFMSRHARMPLLELELNRPDPARFNSFIACLEQRIADAHEQRRLEKDQYVAGEMRMLRRLTEAGVFDPAIYEQAKSRLLEKF